MGLNHLDGSLDTIEFRLSWDFLSQQIYQGLYYENFYGRNLQIFVISWSVYPRKVFPA